MPKRPDDTILKIKFEIEKLEKQIETEKIRLATLRSLLPENENAEKPVQFVLTKAIKEVLEAHRGQFVPLNDIHMEIAQNWNGYYPLKKSLAITLGVWAKSGKVKKDEAKNGFMLP